MMKLFLQILAVILNAFSKVVKSDAKPIPLCHVYGRYGLNAPAFVGHVTAPSVSTNAATGITKTQLTGNGNITNTGGANPTERGFCYLVGAGTPTTSDSVVSTSGSFGTGAYSQNITGLTPGTLYSVRAYAINSAGTGYGATIQLYTTGDLSETVTENFAGDVFDASIWTGFGSNREVTNAQLELTVRGDGANYKGIETIARYQLSGSYFGAEVVNAGNQSLTQLEVQIGAFLTVNVDQVAIVISNGDLLALRRVSSTQTTLATITYNPTNHRYLRLRSNGTTLFYEHSPDGVTYTSFHSLAHPIELDAVVVQVVAGAWAATGSETLVVFDNINLAGFTPSTDTHSIDALKKARVLPSGTINSLLKARISLGHSIDAYLSKRESDSQSVDSLIKARQSISNSIDAFLFGSEKRDHSIDAFLNKRETDSFTLDAYLAARDDVASSVDAYLKERSSITGTIDAFIKARQTATNTLDSILAIRGAVSGSIDAYLYREFEFQNTLDSLLYEKAEEVFTINSLLKLRDSIDNTLDSLLKGQLTSSHSIDSFLFGAGKSSHSIDGLLKKAGIIESQSIDSLFKERKSIQSSIDAMLAVKNEEDVTHSIDGLLKARAENQSSIDSLLKRGGIENSHSIDAVLSVRYDVEQSIDAMLKLREDVQSSIDAIVKGRLDASQSIDALLARAGDFESVTIDSILKARTSIESSIDGLISGGAEEFNTLDALLKATLSVQSSIDAFLTGAESITQSIDATLKIRNGISHGVFGSIRRTNLIRGEKELTRKDGPMTGIKKGEGISLTRREDSPKLTHTGGDVSLTRKGDTLES